MAPRKTNSKELTRELIIKQARTQFIDKGYQQISMRNIAAQLGCSHGAIYYYFKNKAELFYAIVEEDFAKLNDQIEQVIQGPEDDSKKLSNILIRFIEFGLNHQSQFEIMFLVRNNEVDSLSQTAANESYQKFAQAVQSLAKKRIRIIDIWSAFLALHGFVSHYRGYVDHFDEAKLAAESHVNFVIKGLIG